jgi:hypothetical protein
MKRQVVWEKWRDPFGSNDEELEWPGYDLPSGDLIRNEDLDEYQSIMDEYEAEMAESQPAKMLVTPMGVVPMPEHSHPSKIFNFWNGHTNFSITPSVVKIIETVDGVETLDIFTRYRFRIGVGKLFDDSQVMFDIQEALYAQWPEEQ